MPPCFQWAAGEKMCPLHPGLCQLVIDRDPSPNCGAPPSSPAALLARVSGRRGSQAAFFSVCGGALVGVAAATLLGGGGTTLALALLGKLGASGAFTVLFLYTGEVVGWWPRRRGVGGQWVLIWGIGGGRISACRGWGGRVSACYGWVGAVASAPAAAAQPRQAPAAAGADATAPAPSPARRAPRVARHSGNDRWSRSSPRWW